MHGFKLHQFEGFFHVARTGSYTRAAEAFSYPIGQPAVYQQVRGLQEDLGVALVRQAGPRKTELTPEGRALYEFLAPFFEGLPGLMERMRQGSAAPLLIAADQFLALSALPAALMKARDALPGFQARVDELPAAEIVDRVQRGIADAGLLHFPEAPANLSWTPLGRIGVALMIPKRHALAKLNRLPTPAEIAEHPLIVYGPGEPRRALTERLFRRQNLRVKIAAEVSFSQTMRAMVREGVAPAFVPYLLSGRRGRPENETLPREAGTVAFDISAQLKDGALPFGLLYRAGMEDSIPFQILTKELKDAWG